MKKVILILLILFPFVIANCYSANYKSESRKDIDLKQKTTTTVKPKDTKAQNIDIHAVIDEKIIEVTSNIDISDLNIQIEDEQGNIVFDNTLSISKFIFFPIYIGDYKNGNYYIEIKFKNTNIYGEFSL